MSALLSHMFIPLCCQLQCTNTLGTAHLLAFKHNTESLKRNCMCSNDCSFTDELELNQQRGRRRWKTTLLAQYAAEQEERRWGRTVKGGQRGARRPVWLICTWRLEAKRYCGYCLIWTSLTVTLTQFITIFWMSLFPQQTVIWHRITFLSVTQFFLLWAMMSHSCWPNPLFTLPLKFRHGKLWGIILVWNVNWHLNKKKKQSPFCLTGGSVEGFGVHHK